MFRWPAEYHVGRETKREATMAQKTLVQLIDDLDGDEASETITFGLDGQEFEIDLNEANAKALRKTLSPYAEVARSTGGRRRGRQARSAPSGKKPQAFDPKAVRAWAAANGIQLSNRGRIPADVLDKFRAAGN